MTNRFKAAISLFFISTVFISCSARYALQVSDSSHISKNLALSDSSHKTSSSSLAVHVDSSTSKQSHEVTESDKSGNKETIKVDSGSLVFSGGGITAIGTGISVSKSKEKEKKSNTTDVSIYKKTISDLRSQHSVDSSNLKRLTYQLESTSVKKAEVSATYTASNIWAYIIGAPLFIILGGVVLAIIIGLIVITVFKFVFGLVKRKAVQ